MFTGCDVMYDVVMKSLLYEDDILHFLRSDINKSRLV